MTDVLIYTLVALYFLAPIVISALKGKYGFACVGIVFHLFPLIGTCRLAKPNSVWARKWYDDAKMAKARERFA
jgi:hypothetical protein